MSVSPTVESALKSTLYGVRASQRGSRSTPNPVALFRFDASSSLNPLLNSYLLPSAHPFRRLPKSFISHYLLGFRDEGALRSGDMRHGAELILQVAAGISLARPILLSLAISTPSTSAIFEVKWPTLFPDNVAA